MSNVNKNFVIVECDNDERLAKKLIESTAIINRYEIYHGNGKGEILKKLNKFRDSIIILDEDFESSWPQEYRYIIKNSDSVESLRNLRIYIDKDRRILILILSPNLEGWFRENCSHLNNKSLAEIKRRFKEYIEQCKETIDLLKETLKELINLVF